jgi:hypothetical protein
MKLSKKQKQELALRLFAVVFGFVAIIYAVTLINEAKRERIQQEQKDNFKRSYAPPFENSDSLELIK